MVTNFLEPTEVSRLPSNVQQLVPARSEFSKSGPRKSVVFTESTELFILVRCTEQKIKIIISKKNLNDLQSKLYK
jgi:hypothetical protein